MSRWRSPDGTLKLRYVIPLWAAAWWAYFGVLYLIVDNL